MNTEFSFLKTSCRTKVKDTSLSNYFPLARGKIVRFMPLKRKQPHPGFELVLPYSFP